MNRENENNRELSAAEKARSESFEKAKKQLIENGYEEMDLTVGLVNANIMAFVLSLPFIILFAVLFALRNISDWSAFIAQVIDGAVMGLIVFTVAFFVLVVVHELIHGLTWAVFAKKHWKAISFGFIVKYMTPYCCCDEAMKKWQYVIGALMPTLLLGVVPAAVSVFTGSVLLFVIGSFMITAGGGDLTIVLKLLTFSAQGREVLYIDHPYQVGLVAFIR